MRVYLQGDLRRLYDVAWRMLPLSVQSDLKALIVSVRSVDTLNGAKIRCADRSYYESDHEAVAWFALRSQHHALDVVRTCLHPAMDELERWTSLAIDALLKDL